MDAKIILNASIVFAAFLIIIGIIYSIMSSQGLRKRKAELAELHKSLKVGVEVMFNGGLTGTIEQLDEEFARIKLADKLVIKVSRYAITEILS